MHCRQPSGHPACCCLHESPSGDGRKVGEHCEQSLRAFRVVYVTQFAISPGVVVVTGGVITGFTGGVTGGVTTGVVAVPSREVISS